MRPGDVIPNLEGYHQFDDPVAVVIETSMSCERVADASGILVAAGYHVAEGEPEWSRWRSVVKADWDECGYTEWHTNATGRRWVDILVFGTEDEASTPAPETGQ